MGRTWEIFARICLHVLCGGNLSSRAFCLVRPQVFRFGKNFANRQHIKDAVVLGWGRQIFEKSSQTMGITAVTVNACQCNMKNVTRGKFSSSSRSFIMNRRGYYYNPAQFQGFYGDSMEYPHYFPVYHDMTGRETQPSTSHASIAQENCQVHAGKRFTSKHFFVFAFPIAY